MKQFITALVLLSLAASVQFVTSVQILDQKYPFSNYLDDGTYKLHWDFDLKQQKIDFAVNVSTNGWIGFGVSPNGRMLKSDIVVGWVNSDGSAQFHDRYAVIPHILPPIDESQDWFLNNTNQENGYTIMEFTRPLITCDEKDVDILPGVAHMIFAYHSLGPDSKITLDSLVPEALGSTSLDLIPNGNKEIFTQMKQKKCGQKIKNEL